MIKYSWPVQLWMSQQSMLPSQEQIASTNLPEIQADEVDKVGHETENTSPPIECEDIPEPELVQQVSNEEVREGRFPDNMITFDWPVVSWNKRRSLRLPESDHHSS